MWFLWLGMIASLVSVGLTLSRALSFRRWQVETPLDEAMEFAGYSAKPHPVYRYPILLRASFAAVLVAPAFVSIYDAVLPGVIALGVGIILFFIYDFAGAPVRTTITIMPDALYFEAARGPKRPFLLPVSDIKKVVPTKDGFYIEVKRLAFGNRLPMKCRKADELIVKIEKLLGEGEN